MFSALRRLPDGSLPVSADCLATKDLTASAMLPRCINTFIMLTGCKAESGARDRMHAPEQVNLSQQVLSGQAQLSACCLRAASLAALLCLLQLRYALPSEHAVAEHISCLAKRCLRWSSACHFLGTCVCKRGSSGLKEPPVLAGLAGLKPFSQESRDHPSPSAAHSRLDGQIFGQRRLRHLPIEVSLCRLQCSQGLSSASWGMGGSQGLCNL